MATTPPDVYVAVSPLGSAAAEPQTINDLSPETHISEGVSSGGNSVGDAKLEKSNAGELKIIRKTTESASFGGLDIDVTQPVDANKRRSSILEPLARQTFALLPKVAHNLGTATKPPVVHIRSSSRLSAFERETLDKTGIEPSFSVSDFVVARRKMSYSRSGRSGGASQSDSHSDFDTDADSDIRRGYSMDLGSSAGASGGDARPFEANSRNGGGFARDVSMSDNSNRSNSFSVSTSTSASTATSATGSVSKSSSSASKRLSKRPKGSNRTTLLSTTSVLTGHGLTLETLDEGHDVALMKINVTQVMQRGGYFIKYGRYGSPHTVRFEMSSDNQGVSWQSNKRNKSPEERRVLWEWVTEIKFGQCTKTFARHPQEHLASLSFSLIYKKPGSNERTLDIICEDPNEFVVWSQGSRYLHALCHSPRDKPLSETTLVLSLPIVSGYPSSDWLLDHETGLDVEDTIEEERTIERLLESDVAGDDPFSPGYDGLAQRSEVFEGTEANPIYAISPASSATMSPNANVISPEDTSHNESQIEESISMSKSVLLEISTTYGLKGEVPFLPTTLQRPIKFVTAVGRPVASPGASDSGIVDVSWIQQLIAYVPQRWHRKPWRRVFSLVDDGADFNIMRSRLIESSRVSIRRIMAGGTNADGTNPSQVTRGQATSRRGKAVTVAFQSGRETSGASSNADAKSSTGGSDHSYGDEHNCPSLLLMVDTAGTLFGGFAPSTWTTHPSSTGSDTAFVFTASSETNRVLHVYPALKTQSNTDGGSRQETTYQSTSETGFGFGSMSQHAVRQANETKDSNLSAAGGAAIHLDFHLLHGSTRPNSVFSSPQLTTSSSFRVLALELWAPVQR